MTAYANTLPTTSTVNSLLDARFISQDIDNFVTYGAKSDVTANTAAIAVNTAAATANQSGIAATRGTTGASSHAQILAPPGNLVL